jgi:hypothetical protein
MPNVAIAKKHARPLYITALVLLQTCWHVAPTTAHAQSRAFEFVDNVEIHNAIRNKNESSRVWPQINRTIIADFITRLDAAAPDYVASLTCEGEKPIGLLLTGGEWNGLYGWVRVTDGRIYIVFNDQIFQWINVSREDSGPFAANGSWWTFVHETAHAADLRLLQRQGATFEKTRIVIPSNIKQALYTILEGQVRTLQVELSRKSKDIQSAIKNREGDDAKAARVIVQSRGLPTIYSLANPREALADVVATKLIAKKFKLNSAVDAAAADFLDSMACRKK